MYFENPFISPGLQTRPLQQRLNDDTSSSNIPSSIPDDNFLDQLVRCQGSRIDDQRSPLPGAAAVVALDAEAEPVPPQMRQGATSSGRKSGATVPDEDFFSLIVRFQSGRMDDQRASVPRIENRLVVTVQFLTVIPRESHSFFVIICCVHNKI